MRAAALGFALLVSIAVPAFPQAPARDRPDPTGTAVIRGRVMLAGSDQPLARVDVRASSPTLNMPRAVKTDASGRYEIRNLPAGRYVVSAVKTNFVTGAFGQTRPAGPGKPFDLADGQVAANVNFALARAGVITGRVLDEFGEPFPEVQVAVVRQQYINGERRVMPAQGFSSTNDLGEFRLFGLAPGSYYVSAIFRPFVGGDSDDRSGYAPTYFPGTGNIAEAQRITLAPGQVVSGIAIALQPVHTARVSGIALDASGKPMSGITVMASARAGMPGMSMRTGLVKPDGSFSIAGLPPGDYVLRTSAMDGNTNTATTVVNVSGGDVGDVQLVAAPPSTLKGRIVFEADRAAPQPSAVRVFLSRPDPVLSGGAGATPKDDSTFELKTTGGRGFVVANVMGTTDWRTKRVTMNGEDVTDSGVDIPAGATLGPVVVEMTTRLGELLGTVAGDNGEPERDCWVIAFAQDSRRWQQPTRYVVVARPAEDDHFRLRLPAGDYVVSAAAGLEPDEWQDPEVLSRLREHAVAFSIADGDKKELNLVVTRP